MEGNIHIIEKVLVEVNTNDIKTTNTVKNSISQFLMEEVLPKIESVFKQFETHNTIVRLDKINIDFPLSVNEGFISMSTNVYSRLEEMLKQEIYERILEFSNSSDLQNDKVKEVSSHENLEEIFLFFLEHGYYPWYGNQSHIHRFVKENIWIESYKSGVFIKKFKSLLKQKRVFQRFVYQFPLSMVFSIFLPKSRFAEIETHISGSNSLPLSPLKTSFLNTLFILSTEPIAKEVVSSLESWIKHLQAANEKNSFELNQEILKTIPAAYLNLVEVQQVLNKMLEFQSDYKSGNFRNGPELIHSETGNGKFKDWNSQHPNNVKTEFFEKNVSEIRVQNAGLIILHPFIKQLFIALKMLDKQNKIIPGNKIKAVQILHFLSTGNEEFWEGDLVFEKFLCGIPLKYPLPKESILTERMKEEADNLLKESIKRWPALKNTSPDGLRQMFIQRDGKLIKRDRNFKLIVERMAQDVLLEKLSWNISLVKIPWTKGLLYVEW